MTELALMKLEQSAEWHNIRIKKLEDAQEVHMKTANAFPAMGETMKDHEARLRAVEEAKMKQAGAVGVLCFIASLTAQVLIKLF